MSIVKLVLKPMIFLVNSKKIGGNAQKRTRKLIFQHGSIPLKSKKSVDNSLIYDKKNWLYLRRF